MYFYGYCIQNDWVSRTTNLHQILIKLEHSSVETVQMIQKAAAMGNWWLAVSSRQYACLCITFHGEFFGDILNHQGNSAPLQPRFGALWLLAFPKTKITFEMEEISDCCWDSGKYDGAADADWENCVRSPGAYFERDWGIIVLCTMFLVSALPAKMEALVDTLCLLA